MFRLAVDIGGTFTDVVIADTSGQHWWFAKSLTTRDNLAEGVLHAIDRALEQAGLSAGDIGLILHASTVGTNAVRERKGAQTGLLTTAGFRDVLEIGRQKRYNIYDLFIQRPQPLVPRRHRLELNERTDVNGNILIPVEPENVLSAAGELIAEGCTAIAVCLLHAYRNPASEKVVGNVIRDAFPNIFVSLSSQVLPQYREYERTSTTVVNAYIGPEVSSYLAGLEERFGRRGLPQEYLVMQSHGGLVSSQAVKAHPVQLLESGPAAGAIFAAYVARTLGSPQAVAFDMGGTTAKACLIVDGQPLVTREYEIDAITGYPGSGIPIKTSVVDLIEIGQGGGSIATSHAGRIRVGPESAGAFPGPACYGRGGTEPTVTDANAILGYMPRGSLLGGTLPIQEDLAHEAFNEKVAQPLELSAVEAAWGVNELVNEAMANAIKSVSMARGFHPGQLDLIAFGGAGPVHAASLARKLRIRRVVVPPAAGVGSAIGLLASDMKFEATSAYFARLDECDLDALAHAFEALDARALAQVRHSEQPVSVEHYADMRYVGQGYEITVPLVGNRERAAIEDAFTAAYQHTFAYDNRGAPIEFVTLRSIARQRFPEIRLGWEELRSRIARTEEGAEHRMGRIATDATNSVEAPVILRHQLEVGQILPGPAIVQEMDCTTVIGVGDIAQVDDMGNLIIMIGGTDAGTD